MKKLCHAFCKANNVLSLILFVFGAIFVAILAIILEEAGRAYFEDEASKIATMTGVSIGLAASLILLGIGMAGYIIGKRTLRLIEEDVPKNRLIGYAIALIVVGGFSAAGVVILVTPNRYFGNLQ